MSGAYDASEMTRSLFYRGGSRSLGNIEAQWSDNAAVTVLAAEGYPHHPKRGVINGLDMVRKRAMR